MDGTLALQISKDTVPDLDTAKTDFDKILVVTHIEEIKEAFPTRIEVEKTDAGSNFTVI